MENIFEEQTTSWSLAHQLHLVQTLFFWPCGSQSKEESRCSLQRNERRFKRGKRGKAWFAWVESIWYSWEHRQSFFIIEEITNLTDCTVGTHLVSLHSSWHSNQRMYLCNQYWTKGWRRCLCFLCQPERRCRSFSPSRLSRRRPWLSGGRSDRWNEIQR